MIALLVAASACLAPSARADLAAELQALARPEGWGEFRPGTAVAQESSYDRTGGNDDGFSGKHSFIRKEGEKLVLADLQGPGVIHRIWTPTPTEDFVEFYFDGEAEPRIRVKFIDLFSGAAAPFLEPVVGHEVGGYYCYLPIPYQKSCKILYCGPRIQFHQILYRRLAPGETTPSFPREWSAEEKSALEAARALWRRQGEDLFEGGTAAPRGRVIEKRMTLRPGESQTAFRARGAGRIACIEVSPPSALAGDFKDLVLYATWDGESSPAIAAPLSDFFGFAFGEPAMRALPLGADGERAYCYLPMPFDRSAKLEVRYEPAGDGRKNAPPIDLEFKTRFIRGEGRREGEGRLYAQWRRESPAEGQPYLLAEASGRGHLAGVILQSRGLNPGMTIFFEGDDVTMIDGEIRLHGTGSEDAFNGGWYALADRWDQGHSLPLSGCLSYSIPLARTGGYRFYAGDRVSFEKSLRMTIEHGPEGNKIPVDYASLAFIYADAPPAAENPAPSAEARVVAHATELEFWPQLLPVRAISHGGTLAYVNIKDETHGKNREAYKFAPAGAEGFVKFELETPLAGEYELLLAYFEGPNAGRFRAYHRQSPLGEAIDAHAEKIHFVERHAVGTIALSKGANAVTFRIEGKREGSPAAELAIHRIFLKRK